MRDDLNMINGAAVRYVQTAVAEKKPSELKVIGCDTTVARVISEAQDRWLEKVTVPLLHLGHRANPEWWRQRLNGRTRPVRQGHDELVEISIVMLQFARELARHQPVVCQMLMNASPQLAEMLAEISVTQCLNLARTSVEGGIELHEGRNAAHWRRITRLADGNGRLRDVLNLHAMFRTHYSRIPTRVTA